MLNERINDESFLRKVIFFKMLKSQHLALYLTLSWLVFDD